MPSLSVLTVVLSRPRLMACLLPAFMAAQALEPGLTFQAFTIRRGMAAGS